MAHAKPEYAIVLALIGVFLAIGVPALQRGHLLLGGIFALLAVLAAGWAAIAIARDRGWID